MADQVELFSVQAIQVVSECYFVIGSVDQGLNWHSELIGKIDGYPHSLIVKCSDNVNVRLEKKLDKDIKDEQHLELTQNEW